MVVGWVWLHDLREGVDHRVCQVVRLLSALQQCRVLILVAPVVVRLVQLLSLILTVASVWVRLLLEEAPLRVEGVLVGFFLAVPAGGRALGHDHQWLTVAAHNGHDVLFVLLPRTAGTSTARLTLFIAAAGVGLFIVPGHRRDHKLLSWLLRLLFGGRLGPGFFHLPFRLLSLPVVLLVGSPAGRVLGMMVPAPVSLSG